MSYLNGPRINFWGGGSTNVDTANNDGNGIVDLTTASVISDKTDDQLIDFLRQPGANDKGDNYYSVGGWNYYGDHQVAFMNARVSSFGHPGSVTTSGDIMDLPVYLLGSVDPNSGDGPYGGPVMVDLDPTSSQTTQIYAGGLQIGNENPVLLVRGNSVCHSRFLGLRYDRNSTSPPYLTPGSVYASGTFQLAFPKSAVHSYDKTIQILHDIIEAPNAIGIVLRFSMFEFMPGKSTDEMQPDYARNFNDANPSLGRIIGSIGPWYEGEPATVSPGRLLQNNKLGGAQGLAHLDAANKLISLDLISALQGDQIRQNAQDNTSPIGPNVDYGNLQIGTAAGSLVSTPSLPDCYYLQGGIYDVQLDNNAVDTLTDNAIEITSSKNGLSISESPMRIYSNDRNIYIDYVGDSASMDLQVTELGGPVRSATTVDVASGDSGTLPDAGFLNFPATVSVPAGASSVTFNVSDNGGNAGFLSLNFTIGESASYFINFRKYPIDDFSAVISTGNIPWDIVYENCLRFYYIIFPAMSKRIPLNDQPTINAVAGEILKRTSPQYRDTTLYMPLTRSLSPGKVALLQAYLNGNSN